MKILLVHNFYGKSAPSGENMIFEMERTMLARRGHTIELFTRSSDEIRSTGVMGLCKGAFATPWNPWMANALQKKVAMFEPDIVHVHNTFPLISPAIFSAIGKRTKRVLTLHNYRTVCPAAIPMRDGHVCTLCLDRRNVWPSLRYKCYRDSRFSTLPLAINVALHRMLGTWKKHVDTFIVLSEFQRQQMKQVGFPEEKVFVKPNFILNASLPETKPQKEAAAIFVGRLSAEKGIKTLVEAWKLWGNQAPELRIIGDGPLRHLVTSEQSIRYLGQLSRDETLQEIAKAKLLVLPSEWYETFGMVVIEAFSQGTPAVVSNLGALPSLVQDGVTGIVCAPADAKQLQTKIAAYWSDDQKLAHMGICARAEFEKKYTEEANYQQLLKIYQQTITHAGKYEA